jgi:hypothetical protein
VSSKTPDDHRCAIILLVLAVALSGLIDLKEFITFLSRLFIPIERP